MHHSTWATDYSKYYTSGFALDGYFNVPVLIFIKTRWITRLWFLWSYQEFAYHEFTFFNWKLFIFKYESCNPLTFVVEIKGWTEVLEDFLFNFSNSWLLDGAFVQPDATTILYFVQANWFNIIDHFVGQSDRFSYSWAFWEQYHNSM